MNCAEFEILLCDYIDGTLPSAEKEAFNQHLTACTSCAEFAKDAAGAVAFMERAEEVIPPPALLTQISFAIPKVPKRGFFGAFSSRLHFVLQPRFAMSMAMTILSFSMLGRFAGVEVRQFKPADLSPDKVWAAADDRVHRTWARAVKYYDSLKLVYEVQTRLKEWTEQEEEERRLHQQAGTSQTNTATKQSAGSVANDGKKSVEGRGSK